MNKGLAEIALRVEGLTKRYGDLVAVDQLSLEVRRGEILGFLGPNGAGKTTTLKMLCGLLRPDAGRIELDGSVGVSPQEIVVWEGLTCQEQLEFCGQIYDLPAAEARRRAGDLLEAFGLQEKARALAKTLSGGMLRRLNIALGLVHRPQLLFLDEPQAGLDPQSRVLVREYVRALAGEMTVVVTTHDMEEADKLSDRVCIMDRGQLLVMDTVEGIKGQLGEGDLYEIELAAGEAEALRPHVEGLPGAREGLSVQGDTLRFTSTRDSALLTEILHAVDRQGLTLEQLRLRKTTLEDVFIRLTGRGLRA